MHNAPHRDDWLALRLKLDAALRTEADLRDRMAALESELALVDGARPRGARLLAVLAVAVVSGLAGAAAVQGSARADVARLEGRLLSMEAADIRITRVRDDWSCSLRFRHRTLSEHGVARAVCETHIRCERALYDGLTWCGDHRHLVDDESADRDGDGRVEVDLLGGTAIVDGEAFTF